MADERVSRIPRSLSALAEANQLSPAHLGVFLDIAIGPHVDALPGLYRYSLPAAAERLHVSRRTLERHIGDLERVGLVVADGKTRVVWVPSLALAATNGASPKNVLGWKYCWRQLPPCQVVDTARDWFVARMADRGPEFSEAFAQVVGSPMPSPTTSPMPSPINRQQAAGRRQMEEGRRQQAEEPPAAGVESRQDSESAGDVVAANADPHAVAEEALRRGGLNTPEVIAFVVDAIAAAPWQLTPKHVRDAIDVTLRRMEGRKIRSSRSRLFESMLGDVLCSKEALAREWEETRTRDEIAAIDAQQSRERAQREAEAERLAEEKRLEELRENARAKAARIAALTGDQVAELARKAIENLIVDKASPLTAIDLWHRFDDSQRTAIYTAHRRSFLVQMGVIRQWAEQQGLVERDPVMLKKAGAL